MATIAPSARRAVVDSIDAEVLTDLAELAALAGGAPWGGVFLMDSDGARRGCEHGDVFPLGLPPFEGTPCGLVLDAGAPVVIADAEVDGRFNDLADLTGLWSYAGVPVVEDGALIGTACVAWKAPLEGPVDDVVSALERIASQVPRRLELHRTQAALRTIVATLPDGLLLQDADGTTLMTNPAFSRMLELPGPEQLEGLDRDTMRELIARSPVGAQRLLERSAEVYASGHAIVGLDIELDNGRTLEWDFLPVEGAGGDARRVWHIRDVTARRAAERRAAFSEQRFQTLADAGSPTTAVYQLGPDGQPVFLDELSRELFNVANIGPDDAPDTWTRTLHPDDVDRVAANWAGCFERQAHYSDQYRVFSNGRIRHIVAEGAPIHDADGAFAGFVGTLHDVTDQLESARARAHSEQLARHEHQRLSDLVAGSPEPILSIGPDGRIAGMNPAALQTFGMTRQEAVGKPLTDLVAGADRAFLRSAVEEALEGGERPAALEVLACGARPRMFLSQLVLIPMRRMPVEERNAVVLTAIFRDVSDQHRAQLEHLKRLETERTARQAAEDAQAVLEERLEELHAVTRAKDTFVSMISHELRTPLTAIRAFAGFLDDDGLGDESPVAVIERNVERLERIVGDLLEVKAGIDPAVLHLEEFDLRRLARHEVASHAPSAQETGVVLTALDGPPVMVCGDAGRIGQVIGTLVDNALKFTPAGEQVVVDAQARDGAVVLEVRDTGCGIAPEELPRVFERFYQGSAGRSLAKGSGLGLSIALLIADAHGGQMDVSSRPGEGTTFTMTLPPAFEE
ncbi:ATP-binding protein [Baekduia sp. Peel2402]|uniref:ATP-binding protein n=1 Tax=Baekduia sp. Peel2402 TaxID=3458296 RepID=UPI00403E977A